MNLPEIVTDKTRYDIHKRDLITEISEDIQHFADYEGKLPKKKLFQYIILMYDPDSPMRREVGHYMQRKGTCANAVDFKKEKNGKWSEDVEKMLVGRDSEANKLIAAYLAHLAIPEYTELIVLLEIQRIKSIEAFSGDVNDNTHKTMAAVTESIKRITKSLFGSGEEDEVRDARRALYEHANVEKPPRPEDVVDMLDGDGLPEDFSPYPDYEVETPHFLDDEEPKG
jgi:hypothetical protein